MFLKFLAVLLLLFLSGCAGTKDIDPIEGFNRGVFQFNEGIDKAVLKPVAQGYAKIVPAPGKVMISNFFSNLNDVLVIMNDLLQFKLKQGFSDSMRVLVNSTIGVGGLIDVASPQLEKHNEDFGQTLGKWGVGSGAYLVLPFFGPSSLRDGVGLIVDGSVNPIKTVYPVSDRNQIYASQSVVKRAQLLDAELILDEAVITDRYDMIRSAYLLRRESLVCDGKVTRYDEDE